MLYADVYVKDPIEKVVEDWDFLNERIVANFSAFRPVGDQVYGLHPLKFDANGHMKGPLQMAFCRRTLELGPHGIREQMRSQQLPNSPAIGIAFAGTPHHVEGLFGYWHINDKDEVYVASPPGANDPSCLVIVMPHPKGNETDRFAWYCERCTNMVFMRECVTGRDGFARFWPAERAAVREYNSDLKNRTCWNCGHVNPFGYVAMAHFDRPEERAARMQW